MSRKSQKNKPKTSTTTNDAFIVKKRSVELFNSASEPKAKDTVWLYRIVFTSRKTVFLAAFFCICFVAQPFNNVFAAETETAAVSTEVSEPAPIVTTEQVEPLVISEAVTPIETSDINNETNTDDPDSLLLIEELTETQRASDIIPDTVVDGPETVLPTEQTDPVSFESPEVESATEENIIDPQYYYDEVIVDSIDPRDSEGQFIENLNVVAVVDSDSAFSFGRDECTRIEDGSFYCQERTSDIPQNNTLIAAPDSTGDLEIFLVRDGEQIQITKNTVDDASPYFDEKSKTLVWHRLVEDRYQIISYNPETGEELQLTQGVINNMEPARQGDMIVWQRWVEDNWEIMLYDGKQELQITTSVEHDTAPHINGDLLIWNSQALDGSRMLKTYNVVTQSFTTITDDEGVAVSNPRMVVMYEALYENGDVIMKGFDIVTGEIIPIQAIPRELPDEIPNTDSTGETRALIQNKPNLREGGRDGDESLDPVIVPPLPVVDDYTLDLSNNELLAPEINEIQATIPELIIPAFVEISASASSTQGQ